MFLNSNGLLLALLALTTSARAQQNPAPPSLTRLKPAPLSPVSTGEPELTVAELVARALQNSPQLPLARANLEAAQLRAGAARARLNPALQLVPRLLGDREAADTEILVSQPLDLFGKRRAGADVLAAQARGAQAASLLSERALIVQVKNAATDLFAAQEAEKLGDFQQEVALLFRAAAARRAQLGDVPKVQVQRADLELLRTENELRAARAERLVRRAALNQLIGQAPQTPLRVALPLANDFDAALQIPGGATGGSIPGRAAPNFAATGANATGASGDSSGISAAPTNSSSNSPTALANVLGASDVPIPASSAQIGSDLVTQRASFLSGALSRPDIAGAQANFEARQAQVRALARARYPDIELQVRRGSFFGEGNAGTALRAVVTLPLFDFGSLSREKKAAQAEVRAGQAEVDLLRQQAGAQLEAALIRLDLARQTSETYRIGIVPQTLDLLRKTQIGYAQGASTYLEVLDAQRTLRAVQTEYLQALVGARTGEAALESALGAAPPAGLTGSLLNPSGAAAPPGTAAPGTVPDGTIPPIATNPLDPPASNLPAAGAPLGQGALGDSTRDNAAK